MYTYINFCNCIIFYIHMNVVIDQVKDQDGWILAKYSFACLRNKMELRFINTYSVKKDLQPWTKVLGQICTSGTFLHKARYKNNFTCVTSPPPPMQCWKLSPAISSDFQHCIRWWGASVTCFQKENLHLIQTSVVRHNYTIHQITLSMIVGQYPAILNEQAWSIVYAGFIIRHTGNHFLSNWVYSKQSHARQTDPSCLLG